MTEICNCGKQGTHKVSRVGVPGGRRELADSSKVEITYYCSACYDAMLKATRKSWREYDEWREQNRRKRRA
jgi:glycyl-tRNA synthetase (class II)